MFHQSNQQVVFPTNVSSTQQSSALVLYDGSVVNRSSGADARNEDPGQVESIIKQSKKLQDDLQKLGLKIKHHEDNLKFLKKQTNVLDESILDMQVILGKYHSSAGTQVENGNHDLSQTEENTEARILQKENSAAGIICELKTCHIKQTSNLALTNDVLGVLATLGKVDDDNLSRLFSEYLGLDNMLAIVCKTYKGVKSLEAYDKEGRINKSSGLHGLGSSIGKTLLDDRFLVICLEDLRPHVGEFVADDPQKKLVLPKPRLPTGECAPGFIGFAVNMINVDIKNSSCLTTSGHGLRETLFYSLFSRLQVYRTRTEMLQARSCISDAAISLDGGMIRSTGVFSLGDRKDVEVRFPVSSETSILPADYIKAEENIKISKWEKERFLEDMQREQLLLNHVKHEFDSKKKQLVNFLSQSSSHATQQQPQAWER